MSKRETKAQVEAEGEAETGRRKRGEHERRQRIAKEGSASGNYVEGR
jgi:hypothetical protein